MQIMEGAFQEGDILSGCWTVNSEGSDQGATVGYDGVTEIIVEKAAGPMGWYPIARVMRGDQLWMFLPLHMMQTIEVAPREERN